MDARERFNDPEDALRTAIAGALAGVWTALPCLVTKFTPGAATVEAQPTIKAFVEQQDGSTVAVALPLLVDVPVVFPRGGGATLTFPVAPGDECLVVFASRCIDAWWQSGGVQVPNEARRHDLSDGFALCGPFSQATKIANISTSEVQLRSNDGAASISLNPSTKAVTVATSGAVAITAAGGATITATTTINGNTTINGTLSVSGAISSGVSVSAPRGDFATGAGIGGIEFGTHRHTGVDPGGGTSGGPTT